MLKLPPRTASIALGLLLSTTLPGCARRAVEVPIAAPVPVAVPVKDTPPAELLQCPPAPAGFPLDATAEMPPTVRSATIRVAKALRDTRDRLLRLIEWNAPGTCPAAAG